MRWNVHQNDFESLLLSVERWSTATHHVSDHALTRGPRPPAGLGDGAPREEAGGEALRRRGREEEGEEERGQQRWMDG